MTGGSEGGLTPDSFRLEAIDVTVRIRTNHRARRLILRTNPTGGVVLVLPANITRRRGIAFAEANAGWIARHARVTTSLPFADGARIPILGEPHTIRHSPSLRSILTVENGHILVAGRAEELAGRVADWLRVEARRLLTRKSHAVADLLGAKIAGITLRDTKSRWGSCSPAGRLSYSWRLFLAPEAVLDYVVAHEVAHLRELHHGPAFWLLVEQICPDHRRHRSWLRKHGSSLHRYG